MIKAINIRLIPRLCNYSYRGTETSRQWCVNSKKRWKHRTISLYLWSASKAKAGKNCIICDIKSKYAAICVWGVWREEKIPTEKGQAEKRNCRFHLRALLLLCNNSFIFFLIFIHCPSYALLIFFFSPVFAVVVYNLLFCRDSKQEKNGSERLCFIWHD